MSTSPQHPGSLCSEVDAPSITSRSLGEHSPCFHALCAIELCERFAGSLLGALLLLYLNERLGWSAGAATRMGGAFNGAAYLSSLLGGILADRVLGTRRAVLFGTGLLATGYAVLSMDRGETFYPAAALLVLGHALFKPNIAAALGRLYGLGDRRRDDAYSRFFVALNIGAVLGPVAGGALRAAYGWSVAFAAAALGMLLALAIGMVSYRWLASTAPQARADVTASSAPISSGARSSPAVVVLLIAVFLFTALYEQLGQSLLFWARDCTRRTLWGRTLPPSFLVALPGVLVLLLQPLVTRFLSALAQRGRALGEFSRLQAGVLCPAIAYLLMIMAAVSQERQQATVSLWWLVGCSIGLTIGELLVYPLSLALVTRLAPPSRAATATARWLVACATGQWLAGEIAALWTIWSHTRFFAALISLSLVTATVLTRVRSGMRRSPHPAA